MDYENLLQTYNGRVKHQTNVMLSYTTWYERTFAFAETRNGRGGYATDVVWRQ